MKLTAARWVGVPRPLKIAYTLSWRRLPPPRRWRVCVPGVICSCGAFLLVFAGRLTPAQGVEADVRACGGWGGEPEEPAQPSLDAVGEKEHHGDEDHPVRRDRDV